MKTGKKRTAGIVSHLTALLLAALCLLCACGMRDDARESASPTLSVDVVSLLADAIGQSADALVQAQGLTPAAGAARTDAAYYVYSLDGVSYELALYTDDGGVLTGAVLTAYFAYDTEDNRTAIARAGFAGEPVYDPQPLTGFAQTYLALLEQLDAQAEQAEGVNTLRFTDIADLEDRLASVRIFPWAGESDPWPVRDGMEARLRVQVSRMARADQNGMALRGEDGEILYEDGYTFARVGLIVCTTDE